MSRWLDMAVIPEFCWPNMAVEIPFHGHTIVMSPSDEELACRVSAFDPKGQLDFATGGERIRRFLSCLAWSHRAPIVELFSIGSNNDAPGRLGTGRSARSFSPQAIPAEYIYLPETLEPRVQRALALFREGLGVNSDPFALLSHFKVLNILFRSGESQKAWINSNLSRVMEYRARNRLEALFRASIPNIGSYLYHQGRCAVAHAYSSDIVDPDDYEATGRLSKDLHLMEELAAICIEREFGVPGPETFWASHRDSLGSPYSGLLRSVPASSGCVRYVPT